MQIGGVFSLGSIAVFATVAIIISLVSNPVHGQAQPPTITTSDLTSAGYSVTNQEIPQSSGQYQGPAVYFRVSDVPPGATTSGNLVMVYEGVLTSGSAQSLYTYPNATHQAFTIQGGTGVENTMPNSDSRIAIDFIKNGTYVVVIGPVQQKVEALATSIAGRL